MRSTCFVDDAYDDSTLETCESQFVAVAMWKLLIWKTIGLYWYNSLPETTFRKKKIRNSMKTNYIYTLVIQFLSFPFLFTCYMFKCLTRTNKTAKIYSVSVCVVSFRFEIYVTECFIRLLILPGKYLADWSLLFFFLTLFGAINVAFPVAPLPFQKKITSNCASHSSTRTHTQGNYKIQRECKMDDVDVGCPKWTNILNFFLHPLENN